MLPMYCKTVNCVESMQLLAIVNYVESSDCVESLKFVISSKTCMLASEVIAASKQPQRSDMTSNIK